MPYVMAQSIVDMYFRERINVLKQIYLLLQRVIMTYNFPCFVSCFCKCSTFNMCFSSKANFSHDNIYDRLLKVRKLV